MTDPVWGPLATESDDLGASTAESRHEGLLWDPSGPPPCDGDPVGFVTKDSGARQEFETGSRRDTRAGKGRFDLIPPYPQQRQADLLERGAIKYGDRNWELGQPAMRYLDSAGRHLNKLMSGEKTEDHAAAVVFNMNGFMDVLHEIEEGRLPAELDDRPARMK